MTRRSLAALALGPLLGWSSLVAAATPAVPILPVDALEPGQKATVKTVFEGHRIESFDAEIVGVLRGGRAEGDMILARATSERVIRSGIAQGMSGSPVYVDGKLVGALSSGWTFSREPLFGVTPITEMLRVLDLPTGPETGSAGPSAVDAPGLARGVRYGEFTWDGAAGAVTGPPRADAEASPRGSQPEAAAPARGDASGAAAAWMSRADAGISRLAPLPLPLSCAGLNPAALETARRWLEPLGFSAVPGGRVPDGGPPPDGLQPGAAVAADLLRGDLQISAIGTVTYRDGDRMLIFGHPLFQAGEIRLPLSTAEITAIVPSDLSSFKLGMRGRQAGVATQDRRAAVAGRIGGVVRMLPLSVSIMAAGRARQDFRFETLEDRALAPSLIGIAALNSLLESGGTGASQTLRWTLRVSRPGATPLTLEDASTGEAATAEMINGVVAPLRFLCNNPFQRLILDSVSVVVEVSPAREQWALRSALLMDAAVRPGGRVRVRCGLERWRGGRDTRDLILRLPEEAPPGRYLLWVGGSADLMRYEASRLPGRYRPTSLDDAWQRLGKLRPAEHLYGVLLGRAPEVTTDGRDYPELPLSAYSLLVSGQSAGERGRRGDAATLDEVSLAVNGPVRGELLLEVIVDERAP